LLGKCSISWVRLSNLMPFSYFSDRAFHFWPKWTFIAIFLSTPPSWIGLQSWTSTYTLFIEMVLCQTMIFQISSPRVAEIINRSQQTHAYRSDQVPQLQHIWYILAVQSCIIPWINWQIVNDSCSLTKLHSWNQGPSDHPSYPRTLPYV
jgi:hypothetical protein